MESIQRATSSALVNADIYRSLNSHFKELTASDEGFQALIAEEPTVASPERWSGFANRHEFIRSFQQITLDIFRQSIMGRLRPEVAGWFLRDVPSHAGAAFHLSLADRFYTTPLFFRTDELPGGKLAELQCPGSGWGEYCLLRWAYSHLFNQTDAARIPDLARGFNAALRSVSENPVVHHMIDNASAIASNIYFINSTRLAPSAPLYWGFDPDVRPQDANVVRTHQYLELFGDNLFALRMERCGAGTLFYDHPLVCIFEQKLALALPYMKCTQALYTDAIRELFPYTTLILPEGVTLPDGSTLTTRQFSSLPPHERPYVIKYAGMDPARNWGSRAVYFAKDLSRHNLENLIDGIVSEYQAGGGCWILQCAVPDHESRATVERPQELHTGYCKYSAFYGPTGLLAVSSMLSPRKKVHGQKDTLFAVVVPDEETVAQRREER